MQRNVLLPFIQHKTEKEHRHIREKKENGRKRDGREEGETRKLGER